VGGNRGRLEAEVEVETEIDQGWVSFERSLSEG
jgi:hypothetical protein